MSFAGWLLQQTGRTDEVGDVARRLRADRWQGCEEALAAETYSDLTVHLLFDHDLDPGYVEALRVAHAEWPGVANERQLPPSLKSSAQTQGRAHSPGRETHAPPGTLRVVQKPQWS